MQKYKNVEFRNLNCRISEYKSKTIECIKCRVAEMKIRVQKNVENSNAEHRNQNYINVKIENRKIEIAKNRRRQAEKTRFSPPRLEVHIVPNVNINAKR